MLRAREEWEKGAADEEKAPAHALARAPPTPAPALERAGKRVALGESSTRIVEDAEGRRVVKVGDFAWGGVRDAKASAAVGLPPPPPPPSY